MTRAASKPTQGESRGDWVPPQQGDWTIADYMRLENPPGFYYELIEGHLHMSPAPNIPHQTAVSVLSAHMLMFAHERKLGRVFVAPLDVVLSDDERQTVVEPDIIFVAGANKEILTRKHIRGAPDLLVEVLSPTRPDMDRDTKFKLYMQAGVREYWLVDPDERWIEVWVRRDGKFVMKGRHMAGDVAHCEVLDGFTIPVEVVCPVW